MQQIDCNLLLGWFVGIGIDDGTRHPMTFTPNRARLMEGDVGVSRDTRHTARGASTTGPTMHSVRS